MPITDEYGGGLASADADVVADPSNYETFVAVFSRTYSHSEDPAALVDLYNDFQKVRAKRPNAGSSSLASKLGVPRSTIRKWVDNDAVPYVVQGLQTAETRGWVPMQFESPKFAAINRLVAWVMSSGSIHGDRWGVQFVVDGDDERKRLAATLDELDLEMQEFESAGTGVNGRLFGVTPDGSVLGRVLYSLGAPNGDEKRSDGLSLPAYLQTAPARIRRGWLLEYLRNRERHRDEDEEWISFGEDRPADYKHEFVQLVEDVTGTSARSPGTEMYITGEAIAALELAAERYEQLQSDTDPLPLATLESLVETYTNQEDPRKRLSEYREFKATDGFWTNVARELDIPISRAERWDNGSTPAVAATVEIAEQNGWLDTEWTSTIEALATLVIAIHAGGSIGPSYVPAWRMGGALDGRTRQALEEVGVGVAEQHGRIVPDEHSAALGRLLVAAGAPHAGEENLDQLPDWLYLADADRREDWLRMFLAGRSYRFKERSPTRTIQIDRPQSYFVDIAVLIEAVTGVDAAVHDGRITIPADAVRELGLD